MLAKDNATRDTLRMLISEIKRYEIDNKIDADDSVVLATLKKMIKQRKDSIEQFDKGGRTDLSCLLYTSPSPRDRQKSRMPSSA